jgi:hypothetical protein
MRGFKDDKGCYTRLIFDAFKGQFIDMRMHGPFDALDHVASDSGEAQRGGGQAAPSPRSIRPPPRQSR